MDQSRHRVHGSRAPDRTRRAHSQVGGAVEIEHGSESQRSLMRRALSVGPLDPIALAHIHGFHAFPARLHPVTAAELIRGLTRQGDTVLDPFAGSGTILVEARLLGRRAVGVDANPLAVELQRLKVTETTSEQRHQLLQVASEIAEGAEHRRRTKAGPSHRYGRTDRELFEPHVLLELDGLMVGVSSLKPGWLRSTLSLVVSSLLVKVSRRRSDTSAQMVERRLAAGFTVRLFERKTEELSRRLQEFAERLTGGEPEAEVSLGDARKLTCRSESVDAIVTSPPYPGVYDYLDHHRVRLRWLDLDGSHLDRHEIGSHRKLARADADTATKHWTAELGACLAEMRRVLRPGGTAAVIIADTILAGRPWNADQRLAELAQRHGLKLSAAAWQGRTDFHAPSRGTRGRLPRREHLLLLVPR